MNYLLTIVITLFSVYAQANAVTDKDQVRKWWASNPFGKPGVWLALFLCGISCYCLMQSENDARKQHDNDQKRIDGLQQSLDIATNQLDRANAQIGRQTEMLAEQSTIIAAQSRTIGSIAYNTQTTFDGKQRFIRCFRDLSRLTDLKSEGTCFEGLVCDDGVAMYWFDVKTDLLTGFHFFPNDELNRVLSGMPMDEEFLDANGRLIVPANSELSIVLNDALSRRTPPLMVSGPMKERSDGIIVAELSTLFRYVYRAQYSEFNIAYFKGTRKTDGTRFLMFQYLVNPFVEEPHLRTVSNIKLSAQFMRSLYDISIAEFSQRVIAECRRLGIDPKIRRTDVRRLNAIRVRDDMKSNSPFRRLHKEGN